MKKILKILGISYVLYSLLFNSYGKVIRRILYKPPYNIQHLLR